MSNPAMEATIHELLELKRMREELDGEIIALEDAIKAVMGSEETLIAGAYKVSWTPFTTSHFDSTAFRKDHADLAAAYTKTATVRRFTVR